MGITLHLAPAAWSIQLLQTREHPDPASNGNRQDIDDLADDLEGHDGSYLSERSATTSLGTHPSSQPAVRDRLGALVDD